MTIAEREQQILRVKAASFQPELDEALEQTLRTAVFKSVKTTVEAARMRKLRQNWRSWSGIDLGVRVIFNGVSIPNMGI